MVVYRITIMNGELEKFLSGYNTVNEVDGQLELDNCDGHYEKYVLKKQIVRELGKYLNKKVIETDSDHKRNETSSY